MKAEVSRKTLSQFTVLETLYNLTISVMVWGCFHLVTSLSFWPSLLTIVTTIALLVFGFYLWSKVLRACPEVNALNTHFLKFKFSHRVMNVSVLGLCVILVPIIAHLILPETQGWTLFILQVLETTVMLGVIDVIMFWMFWKHSPRKVATC